MPMIAPTSVMSEAPARAMPKSVTFTLSSSSRITFCGFRSRWITLRRCAKRAATSICFVIAIARAGRAGRRATISSFSVRPSQYSIAM